MTDITTQMVLIGIAWLIALVMTSRVTVRSAHGSVGLPMAFLFSTTFLYIGAFSYLVPGYSHLRANGNLYLKSYQFTEETVLLGALATVIGVLGFFMGCWLASPRRQFAKGVQGSRPSHGRPLLGQSQQPILHITISRQNRFRLLATLGAFGVVGFLLTGADLPIPMLQAMTQVARNIAVVAVCLGAALAVLADRRSTYFRWLLLAGAIPATYVLVWGFTSFGFVVFTCFAGFWLAVLASQRVGAFRIGIGSAGITYLLLSAFVAWMSFREELRQVLWNQSAGFVERLEAVVGAFSHTEWLRPSNFESLDWLNIRLNQYVFVGKAVEYHEIFPNLKLWGETIMLAPFALIPRFLWPGKPEMGGSSMVAEHTGMNFSASSTFGAGPVFELFVNFGWYGILLGFVALGIIVRLIDRAASRALRSGQLLDFARWFAVGLAFIAPLTDFFFMVNTAMMTFILMTFIKYGLSSLERAPMATRRTSHSAAPPTSEPPPYRGAEPARAPLPRKQLPAQPLRTVPR